MEILVFGNPLVSEDTAAVEVGNLLKMMGYKVTFSDDPFEIVGKGRGYVILDTVHGIDRVTIVDVNSIETDKHYSVHGIDLGTVIRICQQMNEQVPLIIGIPTNADPEEVIEDVISKIKEVGKKQ